MKKKEKASADPNALSPMMRQYLAVKKQFPDTIVFFRLGDFYEMFFDDAKLVSRELDLTLTGRDCGQGERAPMCGVPFHSYEPYMARLIAKGYKVAICEQVEDPALAKGIVKRDIVRVVTPGTVIEGSMLDESRNNYICAVCVRGETAGVCFADVSTGELYGTRLRGDLAEALPNEFARYSPREALLNAAAANLASVPAFLKDRLSAHLETLSDADFDEEGAKALVLAQFQEDTLEALGLSDKPELLCALGALLCYLQRTQRTGIERLTQLQLYSGAQYMRLDYNARRNLELLETMRTKDKRGSLLGVLDKTRTPMGKRLIRSWIERPLLSPAAISRRLNAVEELMEDALLRDTLTDALDGIHDLERVMSRIVYGNANGRDLRALESAARCLPPLREALKEVHSEMLRGIEQDIDALEDVAALIDRAIVDDPPFSVREGGIIKPGYHEALDLVRGDMTGGRDVLAQIEAQEREKTDIPKLKVGYNRVFGYYIEIPNAFRDRVPDSYVRKQTLTNCERYITPELKELEGRILGAHDRSVQMEYQLFDSVRKEVAKELVRVQKTARAVARLDVLLSFARVSVQNHYTRPTVDVSGKILLKESRHPVVESLSAAPFVPNDVLLDEDENRVCVITGPNMAGKSTYMRQVALIVLMAQIGCFVPATSAQIGIVDAVYTRVGASDDLASGQSTFMIEMSEVAEILKNATAHSLLILDEIGRGTSTYDGMSIARAVLEFVANPKTLGAKTLFATHYHELTELESLLAGVKNYNIACKKHGDDITFLRRIVRGGADDSYGIEVAKLAGVPDKVIRRAKEILKELTEGQPVSAPKGPKPKQAQQEMPAQLMLTPPNESEVLRRLREMDVNTLTPIECMHELFALSKLAKEGT